AREAPTAELRDAARASGMTVMRESGLDLVNAGVTTLAELDRVLGEEIEAEPDDGASFTVELPAWAAPAASSRPSVAVPQAAPQTAPQSLPPQIQRVTGAMPPEDNRRALIVDDDATTRAVTRALLSTEGFAIAEAADGTDAVKALKADPVWDLVVLDLDMPLLDGRDVLRIIRSSPSTAALPVVVLTGTPDERAEFQVLELGADDYIRKPIDAPQFLGRVRAVLRRAGSARFG
ncbi:MAG: response regulator, partial [Gemmatimonadales bacterium]